MSYISTEDVKKIRVALKNEFGKKLKFGVRKSAGGHSVGVTIKSGAVDFSNLMKTAGFGEYVQVNQYHLGNYGVHKEDEQSDSIKISGLICKNFSYEFSRPLADISLKNYLIKNKLFGISDLDTRALVNYIRQNGAMNAVISTEIEQEENTKETVRKLLSL